MAPREPRKPRKHQTQNELNTMNTTNNMNSNIHDEHHDDHPPRRTYLRAGLAIEPLVLPVPIATTLRYERYPVLCPDHNQVMRKYLKLSVAPLVCPVPSCKFEQFNEKMRTWKL